MISWIYYFATTLWESNICVCVTYNSASANNNWSVLPKKLVWAVFSKVNKVFLFFLLKFTFLVLASVLKSWQGVNLLWKCKKKICPFFWRQKTSKTQTWDEHLQMNSSYSPLIYMTEWLNYLNALQSWWKNLTSCWINGLKTFAKNVIGKT